MLPEKKPVNETYSYKIIGFLSKDLWSEYFQLMIYSRFLSDALIHSIDMCRMQRFLAVLRSFYLSSLLYTLSFHPFPPTSLPSSLTSACHLFLGLPLILVTSKFIYIYIYIYIYNTFLGILFSFILCTCPHQCNLFNLIVSCYSGFLTTLVRCWS